MTTSELSQSGVHIPFEDRAQQQAAVKFGMWIFLATEVLFFGGLFVCYVVYRFEYRQAFQAGSQQLGLLSGGLMTAILLTGSLLVAICDEKCEDFHVEDAKLRRSVTSRLLITAGLGILFLGLEFHEYYNLVHDHLFPGKSFLLDGFAGASATGRSDQLFFVLFFCTTGLHAFHMIVAIGLVTSLAARFWWSKRPDLLTNSMSAIGLYWHFVDIVWVFLYPMFYLIR